MVKQFVSAEDVHKKRVETRQVKQRVKSTGRVQNRPEAGVTVD